MTQLYKINVKLSPNQKNNLSKTVGDGTLHVPSTVVK